MERSSGLAEFGNMAASLVSGPAVEERIKVVPKEDEGGLGGTAEMRTSEGSDRIRWARLGITAEEGATKMMS